MEIMMLTDDGMNCYYDDDDDDDEIGGGVDSAVETHRLTTIPYKLTHLHKFTLS